MRAISRSLVALLLATAVVGQSFDYPDFTDTSGLNLLGDVANVGASIRMNGAPGQTGWVWRTTQVPVTGGFETTFVQRFAFVSGNALGGGYCFVIHGDPDGAQTTGGGAFALGYGRGPTNETGIRHSLVIEFDVYRDTLLRDQFLHEISVHTRGPDPNNELEQWSIASVQAPILVNMQTRPIRIRYTPGLLEIFHSDLTTPILSVPYDLVHGGSYLDGRPAPGLGLPSGDAYVGFTAATRASSPSLAQTVHLRSWHWTAVVGCMRGMLADDTLTVEGSHGGPSRRVALATFQPFTIDVRNPPGSASGAPYVLFASLQIQPGAPGTSLGFGEMCFPVLPPGPNEFVVADSFGIFSAPFQAAPTPDQLQIPSGVIQVPTRLALQAVLLRPQPLALGISNAIEVEFTTSPAPQILTTTPTSAAAGQAITIQGRNFVPGMQVAINGTAIQPTVATADSVVFPFPAGLTCDSQVTITNPDGQSASAAINPTPAVTGTSLATGTSLGSAWFFVTGNGFAPGTTVTIGGAAAQLVTVHPNQITMLTPPGTPGVATVLVTTPGGCSTTTTYTYQ